MSGHEGSGGERERLDLAATLGELERKLRELERDLAAGPEGSAAPPRDADPTPAAAPAPAAAESPREPPGGPPEIDLSAQIEELMRFRERLAHSMRTLLEDCSRM